MDSGYHYFSPFVRVHENQVQHPSNNISIMERFINILGEGTTTPIDFSILTSALLQVLLEAFKELISMKISETNTGRDTVPIKIIMLSIIQGSKGIRQ